MALSLELLQKSRVWIFVWSNFHTKSGVNSTKKKKQTPVRMELYLVLNEVKLKMCFENLLIGHH